MALNKVQRRMSLRVVSGDAAGVIAGITPLDLLAKELKSSKGRWTHRLIPVIERWTARRHGEVNFHLTQVRLGSLNRFGKLESSECWYCENHNDDQYNS
ncbi:Uncharacterized protein FWK35_00013841 [Aphis craccivora]|uniref:Uncharacterized protein n=1 Tax=Aphis craccivora TaxID=307492 RepID=A0A6G0Y6V9_APHCR|nr:Uncharacterized protein FWK35_00013841 [Aphis craccivora]